MTDAASNLASRPDDAGAARFGEGGCRVGSKPAGERRPG
jgi:hypothetical protein